MVGVLIGIGCVILACALLAFVYWVVYFLPGRARRRAIETQYEDTLAKFEEKYRK